MSEGLIVLATFLVAGILVLAIIRADEKAERAQEAWFNDPRRPWNPDALPAPDPQAHADGGQER